MYLVTWRQQLSPERLVADRVMQFQGTAEDLARGNLSLWINTESCFVWREADEAPVSGAATVSCL